MILTERIITVNGNISTLDAPIYLYQGDKNVDIYFSIVNPKYKFSKKVVDNLLGETAAYFDLYIIKPDGSQVSFKNQAIEDKKAKWTIESELIDEEIEIGKYDFQIRLLDENKTSILTIPPLLGQLEILKPIYTDSDTPSNNLVNLAATNYALATSGNNDVVVFDEDGNYVATVWTDKMKITDTLLNKIETAIKQNTAQYKEIVNKIGSGNITNNIEPLDTDLPNVYITGTLPTSKSQGDLPITIHYISKTLDFKNYGTLKVQGASSAGYPKKNFTLKLYKDEQHVSKDKKQFKQWGELNKFVLKAHWMDCSHVRNVGTAKIWGKIAKSRSDYDTLPEEFKKSPNAGATDGFTVRVFANGIYQGLYEWIVPKDKLFGQDSDNINHSILNSELNNQASCAFATTSPTINGNWSEELQDTLSSATSTSFSNFIKFVAGSTDADFITNAENYFDVQSVIDYDIFARIFCIVDNLCRNQIFFTYDGTKWFEGVWDLDAVLGLPPTTRGFYTYNTEFQNGYVAYADYKVTNMLYQRVEILFMDRFKARYNELRANILSNEGILEVYEKLMKVIKSYDGLLEEDYATTTGEGKFTGIPYQKENNIQQIRTFIAKRLIYMDECVNAIHQAVPCTNITLDKTKLTITGTGSTTPTTETISTTWTSGALSRTQVTVDVKGVPFGDCFDSSNDITTDFIACTSSNTFAIVTPTAISVGGGAGVVGYDSNKNAIAVYEYKDNQYSWTNGISNDEVACTIGGTNIPIQNIPSNVAYIKICINQTTSTGTTITKTSNTSQQTLTATLTPTDTTDKVVWSVSPSGICSVNNGVVKPIKNGTCVITATCGTHSATCNVTVSGMEEQPSTPGTYVTDGLYGAYDLTQLQTDATTVEDLSGNNNTFNIDAGTIQQDDKGGLIGADGLQIINGSFNPQTTEATIEYTFKYTGINDCDVNLSYPNRTCGINGSNGLGYYMWLGGAGYNIFKNNKEIAKDIQLTNKLVNGQYYHIVVTYTKTDAKMYINNKLLGTYTHTVSTIPNNCNYYIGNTGGGACSAQTLYSTRFYTKALSAEEIAQNYQYEFTKLGVETN